MNALSKLVMVPAAAAVTFLLFAPAVSAGDKQEIVVSSADMDWFRDKASRNLGRQLDLVSRVSRENPSDGIVQIRFTLDQRGRPAGLDVVTNTANVAAKRVAMRAVGLMRGLDKAPVTDWKSAQFQANIAFAENPLEKEKLLEQLQGREARRLASASSESSVVAFGT